MILQALCSFYQRMRDAEPNANSPETASYGFAMQNVNLEIVLSTNGDLQSVNLIGTRDEKKPRPASMLVPISPKRSGQKPAPAFLCENVAFLFGVYDKPEGAAYRFAASADIHRQVLAGVNDEGALAILRFFEKRVQGQILYEGVDTAALENPRNVAVFRLDAAAEYIHERPAVRDAWIRYIARADASAPIVQCLVTGQKAPLARLHGNVAGFGQDKPTLVGFNQPAFESYGLKQGENAPVGVQAAFEYVTALNLLCADRRHSTNIAGDKLIYWAERKADVEEGIMDALFAGTYAETGKEASNPTPPEETERDMLDASQRERIQAVLSTIRGGGNPQAGMFDPNVRFYILGLASNKTRLIIRFFHQSTFGDLLDKIIAHFRDISINGMKNPFPSPYDILMETAVQRKAENIPKTLETPLMYSILNQARYPISLYLAVIERIRCEAASSAQLVSPLRAGILKGYLIRETKEEIGMGLDKNERDPAYLIGRLFALMEKVQDMAIENLNASIADKYLSAVLASPQMMMPQLVSLNRHHISKLKKDAATTGIAFMYAMQIREILNSLSMRVDENGSYVFPMSLNANEQGKFLLGYYQQVQDIYTKKDKPDGAQEIQPETQNEEEK